MAKLFLYGHQTKARFIAICYGGKVVPFDADKRPLKRELQKQIKDVMVIQERRDYYYLPLDSYGQPNGLVETISLFPIDYENNKKADGDSRIWYLFKDYNQALYRALD